MSSDTKAIIGTIIATGLALAGLFSTLVFGLDSRIDDTNTNLNRGDDRLGTEISSMDTRLRAVEQIPCLTPTPGR